MLLRGTRAGIFVGDLAPPLDGPIVLYFVGLLPVGVLVADRGGGGPLIELPGREIGSLNELPGREVALEALGGGPDGVLERGGGFSTGEISSRYRSPWTRKGRPYSSSHISSSPRKSASILGNSFAILLRIFSSRNNLPGSRRSPLFPRAIKREASWLEFIKD